MAVAHWLRQVVTWPGSTNQHRPLLQSLPLRMNHSGAKINSDVTIFKSGSGRLQWKWGRSSFVFLFYPPTFSTQLSQLSAVFSPPFQLWLIINELEKQRRFLFLCLPRLFHVVAAVVAVVACFQPLRWPIVETLNTFNPPFQARKIVLKL